LQNNRQNCSSVKLDLNHNSVACVKFESQLSLFYTKTSATVVNLP
jgi:hypothetical protein